MESGCKQRIMVNGYFVKYLCNKLFRKCFWFIFKLLSSINMSASTLDVQFTSLLNIFIIDLVEMYYTEQLFGSFNDS